jgi:hypothetical protein
MAIVEFNIGQTRKDLIRAEAHVDETKKERLRNRLRALLIKHQQIKVEFGMTSEAHGLPIVYDEPFTESSTTE